jgi:hypothetical protein
MVGSQQIIGAVRRIANDSHMPVPMRLACLARTRRRDDLVKILLDASVPPAKRQVVRDMASEVLIPVLRHHPQFLSMAALVQYGPDGWDVALVTLDDGMADLVPVQGVSPHLLIAVKEMLKRA